MHLWGRMRKHVDLLATLGLVLVLVVLAANAWLADQNTRQLVHNERWVKHTYDVLVGLDTLLTTLLDAETGERGYLLTAEPRYLQPYQQATPRLGQMLERLALDTTDNPSQQQRLPALQNGINEHIQLLAATLADGTVSRERQLDLLNHEKRSMDGIRQQVAAMREQELDLLAHRMQRSSESFHVTRTVFFATTVVTMSLVVITHAMLRRDILGRRRANARLKSANARLRDGLRAAAKVQASLLPRVALHRDGVNFAWAFQPCEELAGDALNICPLADGQMAVYLLDVSGHGAAAALFAVSVVQALTPTDDGRRLAIGVETPLRAADAIRALDRQFVWDDDLGQFFTISYGLIHPARREFRHASAGHPPAILLRRGWPAAFLDSPAGMPIGLGSTYEESITPVESGDRLYLYSDGVTEAMNSIGELFGGHRLLTAVDKGCSRSLHESIDLILDELRQWRGGGRPHDDISLVAFEIS
jgi:sigma-B regulation protein RsbU (phosphoserine phosphatase)